MVLCEPSSQAAKDPDPDAGAGKAAGTLALLDEMARAESPKAGGLPRGTAQKRKVGSVLGESTANVARCGGDDEDSSEDFEVSKVVTGSTQKRRRERAGERAKIRMTQGGTQQPTQAP